MKFYIGTWQVAPSDGFWLGQDISESESVISTAVKGGISGFDTAQSYGKGQAEQTLAKVLRRFCTTSTTSTASTVTTASKTLQSVKIDTKIMPSTKNVNEVLKVSMQRLKPFSIDCLYLHWPRTGFDNTGYLAEMAKLKEAGIIRKVGICNAPLGMLEDLVQSNLKLDRIQIPISLLWTRDLDETLKLCKENNIEVSAYSPTGMGLLSGKYHRPEDLHDARARSFCFRDKCIKPFQNLLALLSETAKKHNSSNTKIALSWVESKKPDIIVIGARNRIQLEEDLSDMLELSDSELSDLSLAAQELDKASQTVCSNIFSYSW